MRRNPVTPRSASRAHPAAYWRRAVAAALAWLAVAAAGLGTAQAAELLMFEEPGCPWCVRWHREVGVGYPKSEEGRRAPLRRLHVSSARTSGVRLRSPVTATPTFILIEGDAEIGRITGYPGADFFWGMLGELLAKLPREAPKPRDVQIVPSLQAAPGQTTLAARQEGRP
jgi:hypothetical protein